MTTSKSNYESGQSVVGSLSWDPNQGCISFASLNPSDAHHNNLWATTRGSNKSCTKQVYLGLQCMIIKQHRIQCEPTHSVGTAQVKEDRQRAVARLSAHFPPPVLRTLRYRERTVRQRFGLNYCPEHAKSNEFLTRPLERRAVSSTLYLYRIKSFSMTYVKENM